jgi:arylsulfatase A-like enzyme
MGAAVWLAACSAEPGLPAPGAGETPTNLILISLDTVRRDRLSAYGYAKPTSPALRRVAEQGIRYERAVSVSPWTIPSHYTLFTGLYPNRHGVWDYHQKLGEAVPTLAELLAAEGMRTFGIVSAQAIKSAKSFGRGFERFRYINEWRSGPGGRRFIYNSGREVTDLGLHWLDEIREEPFFLFLHYYDAHSDYSPQPRFRKKLVEPYAGELKGRNAELLQVRKGTRQLDAADVAFLSQLYDAELRQLDDEIGRVTRYMDEHGLDENTLLVIVSDHGEEFMEHGKILHGTSYYDETIAIPLILRGPGLPRGLRVEALTSLIDLPPTILGLLGREVPPSMQGVDLSADWTPGRSRAQRSFVFAEADWQNEVPALYRMVRDERYKLILNTRDESVELYDMAADPAETRDVSQQLPEQTANMRDAARRYMSDEFRAESTEQPSPEALEQLRALGYAE